MLPMKSIAAALLLDLLLGCRPVPMTVLDSNTGQLVTIPPCEEYVRGFKRAVIRWDLIGPYMGEEIKIEPSVYKAVGSLGRQHEVEAQKLCDSAFGLYEAGRLNYLYVQRHVPSDLCPPNRRDQSGVRTGEGAAV